MNIIEKLRVLGFLTQNAEKNPKSNKNSIINMENILFGENQLIPLENDAKDVYFQMLYKIAKDKGGRETLKVSLVKMEDEQPTDYIKDEEICVGYETIIALIHWILTDRNYPSYTSCLDFTNAIKASYQQYINAEIESPFKDMNGKPYPEEIIVKNINARISADMLKCYNELNPNKQINNRQLNSTIMDEVLFHGLYSLLNLKCENIPNISARDSLVNGIRSLPGFHSLEETLIRPTNKDFENAVGIERIASVAENGIDWNKNNEKDIEQSQS